MKTTEAELLEERKMALGLWNQDKYEE
jgi:hypothetical protein